MSDFYTVLVNDTARLLQKYIAVSIGIVASCPSLMFNTILVTDAAGLQSKNRSQTTQHCESLVKNTS